MARPQRSARFALAENQCKILEMVPGAGCVTDVLGAAFTEIGDIKVNQTSNNGARLKTSLSELDLIDEALLWNGFLS